MGPPLNDLIVWLSREQHSSVPDLLPSLCLVASSKNLQFQLSVKNQRVFVPPTCLQGDKHKVAKWCFQRREQPTCSECLSLTGQRRPLLWPVEITDGFPCLSSFEMTNAACMFEALLEFIDWRESPCIIDCAAYTPGTFSENFWKLSQ